MSRLRLKISHLTSRRVPALSLIGVALAGMVVGVFAASIIVTQNSFTGETGTFNNNTGTMTVTDNGLSILASAGGVTANTTATFGASGNQNLYSGATFTAGHWVDTIVFTNTATDSIAHTVKITIKTGTGATGTTLASFPVTLTLTGAGATSGTITATFDLGTTSITAPMTVYVTST